ncbi:GPI13 / ethanolamine phosphotransferase [Leishmania donovani]|uniref:Ethanolamine_phosphotransferase_putative/GeneDB:L mjF.24.0340 n=1 Tax=Leishmania donovani TaxID=5661 RepID=A0A6J8FB64_LEIDO|nr:GPI13 / ethanolamine phosphotransferase [Leishmania donovani]VDZ44980.1 ethanolamine_phosphotransferase_putative/GeneDB:LmjF.24.0340 [Leishmania donovani]
MTRYQRFSWCPVLLVMALYTGSVLLFTTSMLSTSTVMRTVATEPCSGTKVPPADQVILILIDALRPDFVLSSLRPFARTGGQCTAHEDALGRQRLDGVYTGPTLHYMEESLRSSRSASVAFFLVADAPTTTAQRIKAIATGTMPAFLEAGSNFNSEAIELDSILRQVNGSAVLLGDDTWEKMFPNTPARRHWKRAVGIPSFDVADFDTNDNAVLAEVYSVLAAETPEAVSRASFGSHAEAEEQEGHARLVVVHFLGIDHVGHRVDSDNPFMNGKILQLDQMLRNVSRTLRERATSMNTMLLVLGDHGMTNSGDHGGGSAQETDTFLFAEYFSGTESGATHAHPRSSPGAKLARAQALIEQRWRDGVDAEFDRLRSCHARAGVPRDRLGATYQVDVTATVAVLLGRPIPYSNFGRVIPEVMVLANSSADIDAVERCNLRQLQRYFKESEMKVPRDASWTRPGISVTQQLADMSLYARRTRTDMSRLGMFLGSTGLLLCAMSLLWSPTIRAHVLPCSGAGWFMRWTALTLLLRLCSVFSNSFVVNEDSEVLGLLSSLLVFLLASRVSESWAQRRLSRAGPSSPDDGAKLTTAQQSYRLTALDGICRVATILPRETIFLGLLAVGLRLGVPMLLRYRAHITHTVDTESAVDRVLLRLPAGLRFERVGIAFGGVAWSALYPHHVGRTTVVVTCACLALVYHVPVAHHAVPLLCIAAYPLACKWTSSSSVLQRRARSRMTSLAVASGHTAYAYLVTVLWLSSLCNERVGTAIVVALYGTSLPSLCCLLRVEPVLTQGVVLHLSAFVAFFAEGHQCMLNTIDWSSSLVGMHGYNMYAGGALVLSRTFHAFLLVPFALRAWPGAVAAAAVAKVNDSHIDGAACEEARNGHSSAATVALSMPAPRAGVSAAVVITVYTYIMLAQSAISCFNGYIQKTHLMLFPVFCPKLLFDGVIALLTCAAALLALIRLPPSRHCVVFPALTSE